MPVGGIVPGLAAGPCVVRNLIVRIAGVSQPAVGLQELRLVALLICFVQVPALSPPDERRVRFNRKSVAAQVWWTEIDRAREVLAPGSHHFPWKGEDEIERPVIEARVRERLLAFLERQTRQRFDQTLAGWRQWMWSLPYEPHPDYAEFKRVVYSRIDPRMAHFFKPGVPSLIRLDEIDWGGVQVNGIPPLYYPKVIPAGEASYLRDGHVVFGLVINGEARAYPKRILAWHEMARDRVGGVELHVVYCTLCGTVIPYGAEVGGEHRTFGTSGLLYRSNKLMFDHESLSLWSTVEGKPVIGPLAGQALELKAYPVVTTTWREWLAAHPDSSVLSLDTGFERDYSEGAAYRDYFATDSLYFTVPRLDRRLKNKAEVLTLKVRAAAGTDTQPVAIHADFLRRTPVYHLEAMGRRFVVITSRNGANRVYALGTSTAAFPTRAPDRDVVLDADGGRWRVTEDALVSERDPATALPRVPAQRAFWFGWFAQYPDTILIK